MQNKYLRYECAWDPGWLAGWVSDWNQSRVLHQLIPFFAMSSRLGKTVIRSVNSWQKRKENEMEHTKNIHSPLAWLCAMPVYALTSEHYWWWSLAPATQQPPQTNARKSMSVQLWGPSTTITTIHIHSPGQVDYCPIKRQQGECFDLTGWCDLITSWLRINWSTREICPPRACLSPLQPPPSRQVEGH